MSRPIQPDEIPQARQLARAQWNYLLWKLLTLFLFEALLIWWMAEGQWSGLAKALLLMFIAGLPIMIVGIVYGSRQWWRSLEKDLSDGEVHTVELTAYDVLRSRSILTGRGFHHLLGYQGDFIVDKTLLRRAKVGERFRVNYLPETRLVLSAEKVA